jgi:hypothetical protein
MGTEMRSLLVLLIFLALAEPLQHAGGFRFGITIFPSHLARLLVRKPKPRLRRPPGYSFAWPDRNHLGRKRRRAAHRDRQAAGSKQRPLTLRWRLSPSLTSVKLEEQLEEALDRTNVCPLTKKKRIDFAERPAKAGKENDLGCAFGCA